MEFLSNNLFIVIAIGLFIVLRIIGAARKRAAAASKEEEAAAENPTYEAEDDDSNVALGHWEIDKETRPVPQPSYTRKTLEGAAPLTTLAAEPSSKSFAHKIVDTVKVYSAPTYVPDYVAEPTPTVAQVELSPPIPSPGLSALDDLPALKKALVFSEILAPPVSLRN